MSRLLILNVVCSCRVGQRESGWRCQNAVGVIVSWFRMGQVSGAEGRSKSRSDVDNGSGRNSCRMSRLRGWNGVDGSMERDVDEKKGKERAMVRYKVTGGGSTSGKREYCASG